MSHHVAESSSGRRREVVGDEMEPLRYALRFSPPALLLEYGNAARGIKRTRTFRLKKLLETSLDDMTDVVVQRFPSAIARDAVSREQVARLIARLAAIARTRIAGIDLRGDLNRCTTEELDAAKDAMNATFLRNAKRPGDEGYEYDRQVEFGAPTEENDWDDSESEDDILTLP